MRTASSRRTATSKRPDLPKGVPEDLPGCSWVGNRAGEAALVLPGGETTPWFVREAERQAVEAARAYLAERPHLVEHREAASSVARASWVARALPQAGWELYERGTAQIRVATDDAGLVAAAQLLQPGTCLSVIELCDALQSSGAAHLVIEGIAPEAQGMAWTETDLPADLHAQILAAGYRHVAATREGDSWRHLIVHTADPVQARRHGTVDELRRLLTALGVAAGASSSPAASQAQDAERATGTPRQQVPAGWPELPDGLIYAYHRNVPADAARPQAHIFRSAPLPRSPERHEPLCGRQAITTQPPAPAFAHPGLRLCSECRQALHVAATAAVRRAAEVEQAAFPVEGEQPGVVAEVEQAALPVEVERPDVPAEGVQVARRPVAPVVLSPNQQRPIVPRVLFIELQRHPWQLGTLHFWSTCYATATTVRCQQPDGQLLTKHHHQLYCLPDEAAETAMQVAYQALQNALDTLAAALRPLRYADQLAAAGGIDLAPNPLCEWVVFVDDPGTYVRPNWFYSERVPSPVRQQITRHTAHMLYLAGQDSAVPQHKRFRCDDDATWSHIQELHQAALAAEAVWQQVLTNLGTYAVALADRRYQVDEQSAAGEQQNDAGTTLPAFPQLSSRPALAAAGWTWEDHPRMKRRRLVGHRMATDWHRLVQDAVDEARALHQEPAGVAAAAGRLRARGWMLFQTGANWRLWAEGVAEPVVLLTDAGLLLVEGWLAQEPDLPIAVIHERVRIESERLRAEEMAGRVASLTKLETEAELFLGLEREAADLGLTLEAGDFGEQLGLCWRYRLTGPQGSDLFAELNPIRHRLATWRTEGDAVAVTPGVTAPVAVEVEPADDLSNIGQPSTWRPGPDAAGVFRRPPGMPARLEVDPATLVVGRWQPRQTMNDDELESLAQQLRDLGQLDDLLVLVNEQGRLEVIAGHRRRAAALRIGLPLWVKVVEVTLLQADTIAITSNDQRVDLTDLERGRHYRVMQERHHLSVAELARQVGETRTVVSQRLMLTTLAPEVQAALERQALTFSQARGLHEGSGGDHAAQRAALEQLLVMQEAGERATEATAKALARAQLVGEAPAAGEAAARDQALEEPPAEVPVATDEVSAPLVETSTATDEPPAGAAEDLPPQLTRLGCALVEPVPGWLAIENRLSEEIARRPAEQRAELVVAAAHQVLLQEATGYGLVVEGRAADTYQLYKGGYGALTPPLSALEALEWLIGAHAHLVQEGRFDGVRWDQLGRLGVALGVAATVDWLDAELPGYGLVVHPALPDGVPLTLPESIEQLRIAAARNALAQLAQLPAAVSDDLTALRDRAEALGAIVSYRGTSLDLLAPAWSMDQKVGIKPDALAKQVATWEREARTLVGLPVEQAHQPGGAPAEEAAPAEQGEEPAPVLVRAPVLVVEDATVFAAAEASCSTGDGFLRSGRIKKPFSYQGELWIDVGGISGEGVRARRWCVRVVPPGTPYVPGEWPALYRVLTPYLPGKQPVLYHDGPYCGEHVFHGSTEYVMTGRFMEVLCPSPELAAAEHDQATTSPMPFWTTTPRAAAPWRTLQTARTPGEAMRAALQLAAELFEELGPSQVDAPAPDEAILEGFLQLSERLRVVVEALRQKRLA